MGLDIPIDSLEIVTKYISSLHGYIRHSLLLFEPTTIDEASVKAMHLEHKETYEQNDHPKRAATTKRRGAKTSCTHYEKEGNEEDNCWKLHPELRPKRDDRKERQKRAASMKQDQKFESEEDEKVTAAGVARGRPIDLGSDFGDERRITTLGITIDVPINLGLDSDDETKISINSVPKMKRSPNAAWLQEIEDINKRIKP